MEQLPTVTVVTPWRTDSDERRRGEELGVVVRVHVEEAGHDPAAARVDDARAAGASSGVALTATTRPSRMPR